MKRLIAQRPSPAMTVALLALFIAIGGTGYAALKLPKNSVGTKQLKANAVRSSKVDDRSLLAKDFKAGELPRGRSGPQGIQGPKGETGAQGPQGIQGPKGDIPPVPAAALYSTGSDTTHSAAGTSLHADGELFDTANLHDTANNTESLVAPVSGIYVISATVSWDPLSAGYRRMSIIGPDGGIVASVAGPPLPSPAYTSQNPVGIARLNAGESVHVDALQGSGGDLNARIDRFEMTFVGG